MELPCDLTQVSHAAAQLRRYLREQKCSAAEIMDCELALVESCNNAIKYVRPEANQLPIAIRASCSRHSIDIDVIDHTPGFDWPEMRLPTTVAESGRGLFLIRSMMDEFRYEKGEYSNTMCLRRLRPKRLKSAST